MRQSRVISSGGWWPVPGEGETEIPSRKQFCVSAYVARGSSLLIPGQLKPTLAPRADTRPLGQQAPFPSAAETPHPRLGDGRVTRKGCSKTLQPAVTPATGICCNTRAIPRGGCSQGNWSGWCHYKIPGPEGQHCQESIRAA